MDGLLPGAFIIKVVLQGTANYKDNYLELNGYKWNLTELLAHELTLPCSLRNWVLEIKADKIISPTEIFWRLCKIYCPSKIPPERPGKKLQGWMKLPIMGDHHARSDYCTKAILQLLDFWSSIVWILKRWVTSKYWLIRRKKPSGGKWLSGTTRVNK